MIRQPEIEELKKLLNNTDSSVIGISRGFLEDVVQEYEKSSISELYNQGLNDAWELAKNIIAIDDRSVVFDGHVFVENILRAYTPQEALAKLKTYDEQRKIEVGDVLDNNQNDMLILVTKVYDTSFDGIDNSGIVRASLDLKLWKKTGKHIDIQSILEQIGGE